MYEPVPPEGSDLELDNSITMTTDESVLSFQNLNLNNYTLTLGSETSDLTIINSITINETTEGIVTGKADLSLSASLNISSGSVTSTGGIITVLGGGKLSGAGLLDLSNSEWVLGGDFSKSNGTLTILNTKEIRQRVTDSLKYQMREEWQNV